MSESATYGVTVIGRPRYGWIRRWSAWIGLAAFALGASLSSDLPAARGHVFQSDESTYYAMASSLAHDHDLTWTRDDLARVYREYPSGPQGIFLKRSGAERLVYGKGFLLPLLAAPLVGLLGAQGFWVLHLALLGACVAAGAAWLGTSGGSRGAVATSATFVGASVLPLYARWMTTEVAHFALVFLGTALWFRPPFRPTRLDTRAERLVGTDLAEVGAALIYGLATFLKPIPNVLLVIPLGLACLWRRRIRGGFVVGSVFVLTVAGLFLVNRWATGEFNYQGGDRYTCYFHFPLEDSRARIDDCFSMSTGKLDDTADPKEWLAGWGAYGFGRFGGIAWHFPVGLVALISFLRRPRDPWRWTLLALALVEIGWALYFIPFNYVGGGGAIGNRYFMGTYALLFFLLARPLRPAGLALAWISGGVLLGSVLLSPVAATASPGMHAMSFPWRWFAPDRELLLDLPTNTNPHAFGKPFGNPVRYKLFYLDDAFHGAEKGCEWVPDERARGAGCFWIRGASESEFLLVSAKPIREIHFALRNVPKPNRVRVRVEGRGEDLNLAPDETRMLSIPAGPGFSYHHKGVDSMLYRVSVASQAHYVPALESSDGRQGDSRLLGVFVNLDVDAENDG